MDIFYEQIIKRTNKASDKLLIAGALTLSILLTVMIIYLFLSRITLWGFNFFFIFGIWWLFIRFLGNYNVEYEYTITNHDFDIDMIKGKKQRKHITTINLKKIEYFGNKNDPQTILEMKKTGSPAKEYYFVKNKDSKNIYVTDVISKKDGSKIRVYIEPDQQMKESIRLMNPRAFIGVTGEKI